MENKAAQPLVHQRASAGEAHRCGPCGLWSSSHHGDYRYGTPGSLFIDRSGVVHR